MRVALLGPVEVLRDGTPVDLGTRKQRALLAALALHRGRPVAVDSIVDLLWGDQPPPGVTGTLQAYVAGLRRALEPARAARSPARVLVTVEPGYALRVPEEALDTAVFTDLVARSQRALAPLGAAGLGPVGSGTGVEVGGSTRGSLATAAPPLSEAQLLRTATDLEEALGLWRGTPYAELGDAPAAVAERARLGELRLLAMEELAVARLALGRHAAVAADLEALTAEHPLRERLWALRAVALTRSGRQGEALAVLRQVRDVLDEELGLEPGQELRDLTTAVLRQDPALAWVPPSGTPEPARTETTNGAARPQDAAPLPGATEEESGGAEPFRPPPVGWPMVGREEELAALTDLLDGASAGRAAFAVVTGDPGIGKSRLCRELAVATLERGGAVLLGRCSQDDGAPPLWPWTTVLRGLGRPWPVGVGEEDEGSQFRSWEAVVRTLLADAAERLLLVVLEDLHWADVASLRVLRLLAESAESGRLLVVTTWRASPPPDGALGDVAEALARRHALRLELAGLPEAAGREVVRAVSGASPTEAEAVALRERTDGNPFFLVEYARLARERHGLSDLITEPEPPRAVSDVLARRLQRLPEDTVAVLRGAAVVGRRFDTAAAAAASGTTEDDLLDRLDPALAAGLVREQGVDSFAFSHALVRDTIRATVPATRAARAHVRVAAHLDGLPGREVEAAHHWLAAGPSYSARAWPAAVAAARSATRVHAHDQAADLLGRALTAMGLDPAATPRDRYAVLMELLEAYRWAGDWTSLIAVAEQAVQVADELGDVTLLARAASATISGGLWQSARHGEVNAGIIAALRRALAQLPGGDSVDRCRVMISLANEAYYISGLEERQALVDGAIAMAGRLGDEELLLDVHASAYVPLWCPATMHRRLELAEETVRRADLLGDEPALVVGLTFRAVAECELGMVAQMRASSAEARERAERLRLPYALLVLANLELPWLAMAGRFEEAHARHTEIAELHDRMGLRTTLDALRGAEMVLAQWEGRTADAEQVMVDFRPGHLPVGSTVAALLLRNGRRAEALAYLEHHPIDLSREPWWFSSLEWCMAAEAGYHLGDAALCRRALELLTPYAGCTCTAGSGNSSGPVDAFLALAAAGAGEPELAARHAERATALLEEWQVPLAARWWRDQRDRLAV